jgi:hypothetical protein
MKKEMVRKEEIDTDLFGDEPVIEWHAGDVLYNMVLAFLSFFIFVVVISGLTSPYWLGMDRGNYMTHEEIQQLVVDDLGIKD